MSYDFDDGYLEEKGSLTHMIGFATTKENPFDNLEQITIEESLWAIFPNQGPFPTTLQETTAKIYSEWLPSSDYKLVELPMEFLSQSTIVHRKMYIVKFG